MSDVLQNAREIAASVIEKQADHPGNEGHMARTAADVRAGKHDDATMVQIAVAALSSPPPAVGGEVEEALRELLVAVTFSEPPVNMGGTEDDPNLCYEARVPVEFVTNARAALTPQGGQKP
jgi:hypothetical protein